MEPMVKMMETWRESLWIWMKELSNMWQRREIMWAWANVWFCGHYRMVLGVSTSCVSSALSRLDLPNAFARFVLRPEACCFLLCRVQSGSGLKNCSLDRGCLSEIAFDSPCSWVMSPAQRLQVSILSDGLPIVAGSGTLHMWEEQHWGDFDPFPEERIAMFSMA